MVVILCFEHIGGIVKRFLRFFFLLGFIGCTQNAYSAGGGSASNTSKQRDSFLDNPLIVAIDEGDHAVVQLLLQHGMSATTSHDGLTALMHAAQRDNPACVQALLSGHNGRRADPYATTARGDTALMLAIRAQKPQNVPPLIPATNAALEATNTARESALSIAVNTRQLDIVTMLRAAGVQPDEKTWYEASELRDPAIYAALGTPNGTCTIL